MADYFNPESVNPGYDFKPGGFLGGMKWAQDRQRYEQLAPLQDLIQMLQAKQGLGQAQEYEANAPLREAQRQAGIATAQATTGTIGGLKQAELEKEQEAVRFAKENNPLKIQEQQYKVKSEQMKSVLEELETGHQIAATLAATGDNGPATVATMQQKLKEAGLPEDHPVAKAIMQNPTKAGDIANSIDMAKSNFRLKKMELDAAYKTHTDTARITGQYHLAAAQAQAAARQKDFETELRSRLMQGTDESKLALAAGAEQDPELNPQLKAFARAVGEQALRNLAVKQGLKDFDLGKPTETLKDKTERMQRLLSGNITNSGGPIDFNSLKK